MEEQVFDFVVSFEHGEPVLCVCCAITGEKQRQCSECAEEGE